VKIIADQMIKFPEVKNKDAVGSYPAYVKSGGGYVWDEVLEYRVWCHPHDGAPDSYEGDDYYYAFHNFEDANEFYKENEGSEEPLALILQEEYIDEPEPGNYIHVKEQRVTEWPVRFLSRQKRDLNTIPNFFAPNAPDNRLQILLGLK
jgi:hypothetical protein